MGINEASYLFPGLWRVLVFVVQCAFDGRPDMLLLLSRNFSNQGVSAATSWWSYRKKEALEAPFSTITGDHS